MRECKRTDDFVKEFGKIFTPRKYILKKLYVENVYKEINVLRKKVCIQKVYSKIKCLGKIIHSKTI